MKIPSDFKELLYWVKETTEKRWAIGPQSEAEACAWHHHNSFWGARWDSGLTQGEINNLEKKWDINFPHDYRLFLEILHCIDRPDIIEHDDGDEQYEDEEDVMFYNWKKHSKEIEKRFNWPYETILQDVLGNNQVWLKSWGTRPDNDMDSEAIFQQWYKKAPKLIPIFGHRFIINEQVKTGNPVLSIWGSDIILYGWNLREYLLNELKYDLGIQNITLDEDGWDSEPITEYQAILDENMKIGKTIKIPYWEEMVMYWSSGWASIGKDEPYPTDGACLIVKAEDDKNTPKSFQAFD